MIRVQQERLLRFLGALCQHSSDFGRSVILLALTPMSVPNPEELPPLIQGTWDVHAQLNLLIAGRPRQQHAIEIRRPDPCAISAETNLTLRAPVGTASRPDHASLSISRFEASLEAFRQLRDDNNSLLCAAMLAVATLFRRPRSRTALLVTFTRYLALVEAEAAKTNANQAVICLKQRLDRGREAAINSWQCKAEPLSLAERTLSEIEKFHLPIRDNKWKLLRRLEGGFYWMHLESRDALYHEASCATEACLIPPTILCRLYDEIAAFAIDDVYERSLDVAAFIEYVYYRNLSSIKYDAAYPEHTPHLMHSHAGQKLLWLVGAIEGEYETLLARGKLTSVLNQLTRVIDHIVALDARLATSVDDVSDSRRFLRGLAKRLCARIATFLLAAGQAQNAILYRLWQARITRDNRLSDTLAAQRDELVGLIGMLPAQRTSEVLRQVRTLADGLPKPQRLRRELGDTVGKVVQDESESRDFPQTPSCDFTSFPVAPPGLNARSAQASNPTFDAHANEERSLRERTDAIRLACELAELIVDPIAFDPSLAGTQHAFLYESSNTRTERVRLARRIFRDCSYALRIMRAHSIDYSHDLQRNIGEVYALVIARWANILLNQNLSQLRFGWLQSESRSIQLDRKLTPRSILNRIPAICGRATDALRVGPYSALGRRIESYLHSIRGFAYSHSAVDGRYDRQASVCFNRAHAVLHRPPAAGDTSARATAFLAEAEAEILKSRRLDSSKQHERSAALQNATTLLQQAKHLMAIGRTDNRWRTWYHYLTALRGYCELEALADGTDYVLKRERTGALVEIVLGEIVSGLTTCEATSDMRVVLRLFLARLEQWRENSKIMSKDAWIIARRRCGIPDVPDQLRRERRARVRHEIIEAVSSPESPGNPGAKGKDGGTEAAKIARDPRHPSVPGPENSNTQHNDGMVAP